MDLRDYLLALMRPVQPGDELEPGLRFTDASTELGLRLSFVVHAREKEWQRQTAIAERLGVAPEDIATF